MRLLLFLFVLSFFACKDNKKNTSENTAPNKTPSEVVFLEPQKLNLKSAAQLVELPLSCIEKEYPNKLGQVIGSETDLLSPSSLHPTFYGCFDWHSAVHGHWCLVSLLKQFPELENATKIKNKLLERISEENIKNEILYFEGTHNKTFERTYGWAWLLKLAEELHTWEDPTAKELEKNLQPLTQLIIDKYLDFLPKLNYPIRVGEHSNTAFGLSFAYDYALTFNHEALKTLIEKRAIDFYKNDQNCPLSWEPSGFDFLSPCLEEAALMKRLLPEDDFKFWFEEFLPQLQDPNFSLAVGEVSDRSDGKLVHLDGINFSRACSLYTVAKDLPKLTHLKNIANTHIAYSLPSIVNDSYEGGHWLGSFAIYALNATQE